MRASEQTITGIFLAFFGFLVTAGSTYYYALGGADLVDSEYGLAVGVIIFLLGLYLAYPSGRRR